MKFLHLHLPATNLSGGEAWFRDGYDNFTKHIAAYSALWPDRYSPEKLEAIFQVIHPYYKRAQYDCVPSMGELGYFDVEKFLRYKHPLCEQCWIACDAANTATATGSYTSFVACGSYERSINILSVRHGRWRQDEMQAQLVDFYQCIARLTGIWPEAVVVESAAGGYGIIDMLSNQMPIIPLYPRGSKEERASAVCFLVNTGRCALPESAPWLKAFTEEIENFPLCSSKDTTDAFVHCLAYASRPAEFKPRPIVSVQQYDALEGFRESSTSFADMDSFDEHMEEAEHFLRWRNQQ